MYGTVIVKRTPLLFLPRNIRHWSLGKIGFSLVGKCCSQYSTTCNQPYPVDEDQCSPVNSKQVG